MPRHAWIVGLIRIVALPAVVQVDLLARVVPGDVNCYRIRSSSSFRSFAPHFEGHPLPLFPILVSLGNGGGLVSSVQVHDGFKNRTMLANPRFLLRQTL